MYADDLVSGNIRCMRTLAGFLLSGASNESGVVDDGNFWRLEWLLLRKPDMWPAILYGNRLPLVCL